MDWFQKRSFLKNVNAAIDRLTAERGFALRVAAVIPKVETLFVEWRKEGLSPEHCATMLVADLYPSLLSADLSDEKRKVIIQEINHYSTTRIMPQGHPEFVTLKYIHQDMILTDWVNRNLLPPATALHARLEFTGQLAGLTKEQRRTMGDKIIANAASRS
ncbi:hypothetical protein ILT44_01360 [Microvirga sp. BT689]|uniref:hypothetical protein n=1 Tax=Microvirga arvi TaxID=2778731 RepID=UPI001951D90E|nr:hypothetical protein [Microvirga arvi]MBM6578812.1 hypothetical protein [Microvirga arvi]